MHPLQIHIDETGDTLADFARRVGVAPAALVALINDVGTPDPMLARRIVAASGGALSFDQIMSGRETFVADLTERLTTESALDLGRLADAIADAVRALPGAPDIPDADFEIAAEAAAHTHAALARVTKFNGPARLPQALRPILEEILRDRSALRFDPDALDEAARRASARYHQV